MNNSKASPVAFCRSILVYIFGAPGAKVGVKAGEARDVDVRVLLLLVESFLVSPSLPVGVRL